MTNGQLLLKYLKKETTSVPTYFWGSFFVVNLACVRLLNEKKELLVPYVETEKFFVYEPMSSIKIKGEKYTITKYPNWFNKTVDHAEYFFEGPSLEKLDHLFWRDGELIDLIEKLAYQLTDETDRAAFKSGNITEKDLPNFDITELEKVAELCLAGIEEVNKNWEEITRNFT